MSLVCIGYDFSQVHLIRKCKLLQSVTVLLFYNLKLLQSTRGVNTFLKFGAETSPIEIQCVETLSPFKIPIWRVTDWLLCCMANLERIINTLKNTMPSCFFACLWDLGCLFLEKSRSGFSNPKTDFAFFWSNPITDHESITSRLLVDSRLNFCRFVSSIPGRSAGSFPQQRLVIEPCCILPIQFRSNLDRFSEQKWHTLTRDASCTCMIF